MVEWAKTSLRMHNILISTMAVPSPGYCGPSIAKEGDGQQRGMKLYTEILIYKYFYKNRFVKNFTFK